MKLLFLTPQLPFPPYQGTSLRNYNLIANLARRHQIDLLSFTMPDQSLTPDNPLTSLCSSVTTLPQPDRSQARRILDTLRQPLPDMALRLLHPDMIGLVERQLLATDYDIVQIEGIEMAPYGLAAMQMPTTGKCKPVVVFDDHNCEYLLQKRSALTDLRQPSRLLAALYSIIQWQKLVYYERHVCRSLSRVVAVSQPDATALHALHKGLDITVVPNGIDLDYYATVRASQGRPTRPVRLIFIGKMDYRPNVDAVLWFALQVLPLLVDAGLDVQFDVVGMNPHPRLHVLEQNPHINVVGGVADVRPFLKRAALYVIPMRVGGGTRFKALEAMAAHIPIVSTSLGVEGIGLRHEEQLLIGDSPAAFSAQVQRLLEDIALDGILSAKLVERSYQFVAARFGWSAIVPILEQLYQRPL